MTIYRKKTQESHIKVCYHLKYVLSSLEGRRNRFKNYTDNQNLTSVYKTCIQRSTMKKKRFVFEVNKNKDGDLEFLRSGRSRYAGKMRKCNRIVLDKRSATFNQNLCRIISTPRGTGTVE